MSARFDDLAADARVAFFAEFVALASMANAAAVV